jgi:TonB-linked SusC/RagA family outer membrane protein
MKKNKSFGELFYHSLKKTLLIMRIATILMILGILQAHATDAYSQKTRLTINFTDAELVTVLDKIEEESEFFFLYNEKLLDTDRRVNVAAHDQLIDVILDNLFAGTKINYTIIDRKIILAPDYLSEIVSPQQLKVTGKVTGTDGDPLPGVNVMVKGTTIGVNTDIDGNYSIDVPDNQAILQFSFIGFAPQEIAVGSQRVINISLAESMLQMDEVVVTAFGIRKEKKALAYAVQEVRGDAFTEARMNNVATSLSGKIAGVESTVVNSGAGASSRVIVRGNTSLNGNQQPLYIVDGMPINNTNRGPVTSSTQLNVDRGDGISSMNPDDIESISVLKGGAAAALYGSQAANGVILITTKKGTIQKGIGVEVTSDVNFGTPAVFPNYQYEYGQGNDGIKPANAAAALSSGRLAYGAKMDGSMVMQFDGVERPYSPVYVKDNIKNFYQTAINLSNTVALNAGNQNMQMRLSFSDTRARDQQPNSEYYKKTANLNVRGTLGKNDFIVLESSVQYNLVDGLNRPTVGYAELNAAWPVYLAANVVDVRNMRGTDPDLPGINAATGRELEWNPVPAAVNPYYVAYQLRNEDHSNRFIGRSSIQMNLLSNLFIKATVAKDNSNYRDFNYVPKTNAFTPLGYYNSSQDQTDKTNFQILANYKDKFFADAVGLNLMVGANRERDYGRSSTANGSEWVIPDFFSLTNLKNRDLVNLGQMSTGTNSVFGEANLDYKSIAYLTVTGRQDWFSVLNPGYNAIFYPSVGGSFILSEVVDLPQIFSFAKLRASWAQVGSATVSAGSINQTYTISTVNAYALPTLSNPNTLLNPNIRPITATTTEGGFQVQIFDNRIGLDVNYYSKKTEDDILFPPISQATGYSAGPRNLGLITNKGWEISLTGTPVTTSDFSWNVSFNFGYNKSKIVELAEGIDVLTLGNAIGGPILINAIGLPYSTVRAYVMKRDANGTLIYNAATGYEDRELKDLGVGNPPYLMGLGNNFRYKNFTLTVDIDSKFGAVGYSNAIQYATRFGLTPATLPGREGGLTVTGVDQTGAPFTKLWEVVNLDTYYNNFGSAYPGQFVYKTDFIKLRRMVLKYELPSEILQFVKLQGASVAITGLNLITLYQDKRVKEAGIDPEMQQTVGNAQGSQGVAMPVTRNIGFNLNLRF